MSTEYEKRIFSQHGEDGVIDKLLELIPPTSYFAVEFGALPEDALSNIKNLVVNHGFRRVCWDGQIEDPLYDVYREWVTKENINFLFQKYQVPKDIDFVSIDIDNMDFYIWQALEYRPKIVCIECNRNHGPMEDKVVPYNAEGGKTFYSSTKEKHTNYFGASPLALFRLGIRKNYSLVYTNS